MMPLGRNGRVIIVAALSLGITGCGGLKRVPVQGKVTVKGKPIAGAVVQFIPLGETKGEGGVGRSEADGTFALVAALARSPGVVAGEYRVRVSRFVAVDGKPLPADALDADYPGSGESIPLPYSSAEGSPLKVTVPEAGGDVKIDIPVNVAGYK